MKHYGPVLRRNRDFFWPPVPAGRDIDRRALDHAERAAPPLIPNQKLCGSMSLRTQRRNSR